VTSKPVLRGAMDNDTDHYGDHYNDDDNDDKDCDGDGGSCRHISIDVEKRDHHQQHEKERMTRLEQSLEATLRQNEEMAHRLRALEVWQQQQQHFHVDVPENSVEERQRRLRELEPRQRGRMGATTNRVSSTTTLANVGSGRALAMCQELKKTTKKKVKSLKRAMGQVIVSSKTSKSSSTPKSLTSCSSLKQSRTDPTASASQSHSTAQSLRRPIKRSTPSPTFWAEANNIDGSTGSVTGDPSRFHPPPQESFCEYIHILTPRPRHRHTVEPTTPLSPQTPSIASEQPQRTTVRMPSPLTPTPFPLPQEDQHQSQSQSPSQESALQMIMEEVKKVDSYTRSATETTDRIEPLSLSKGKAKHKKDKDILPVLADRHISAYQYQYHSSYLYPRHLVVFAKNHQEKETDKVRNVRTGTGIINGLGQPQPRPAHKTQAIDDLDVTDAGDGHGAFLIGPWDKTVQSVITDDDDEHAGSVSTGVNAVDNDDSDIDLDIDENSNSNSNSVDTRIPIPLETGVGGGGGTSRSTPTNANTNTLTHDKDYEQENSQQQPHQQDDDEEEDGVECSYAKERVRVTQQLCIFQAFPVRVPVPSIIPLISTMPHCRATSASGSSHPHSISISQSILNTSCTRSTLKDLQHRFQKQPPKMSKFASVNGNGRHNCPLEDDDGDSLALSVCASSCRSCSQSTTATAETTARAGSPPRRQQYSDIVNHKSSSSTNTTRTRYSSKNSGSNCTSKISTMKTACLSMPRTLPIPIPMPLSLNKQITQDCPVCVTPFITKSISTTIEHHENNDTINDDGDGDGDDTTRTTTITLSPISFLLEGAEISIRLDDHEDKPRHNNNNTNANDDVSLSNRRKERRRQRREKSRHTRKKDEGHTNKGDGSKINKSKKHHSSSNSNSKSKSKSSSSKSKATNHQSDTSNSTSSTGASKSTTITPTKAKTDPIVPMTYDTSYEDCPSRIATSAHVGGGTEDTDSGKKEQHPQPQEQLCEGFPSGRSHSRVLVVASGTVFFNTTGESIFLKRQKQRSEAKRREENDKAERIRGSVPLH
jgi:hypothetical protein